MTNTTGAEPADRALLDRARYGRIALRRLLLQQAAVHASSAAHVFLVDADEEPGDLVARAVWLTELAQEVLTAAVLAEREAGTSWRRIGDELPNARTGRIGVTAQSVEGAYGDQARTWAAIRDNALAALDPDRPGRSPADILATIGEWTADHRIDLRAPTEAHPSHEIAALIGLTASAVEAGWTGERLAAVYDRRADAWDRAAALGDNPGAAEEAAANRARAAELRANRE
ncbi:hypothetical protein [Embleya hyalina]|uniref:Uncharacterized protein n=1 Tax=Embleya hyalina TaxID=516124 RepID=A0A401Z429_9ACTN|nr:hypothetical protein [Embleya hyalina]GCE01585.1 hypothetical protein EHYA_09351 [Embleya hyalina]